MGFSIFSDTPIWNPHNFQAFGQPKALIAILIEAHGHGAIVVLMLHDGLVGIMATWLRGKYVKPLDKNVRTKKHGGRTHVAFLVESQHPSNTKENERIQ